MDYYKEYRVNPLFKKEQFIECLRNIGVNAYIEGDSIFYDYDQLKAVSLIDMPHLVYMNLRYMGAQINHGN